MNIDKAKLKTFALHTLFKPTTLEGAMQKLRFVQADPIRSPARAQDLILRHRVIDYRAKDLEREYQNLDIEEDILYMYGFLAREISNLWHPIKPKGLTKFDKKVLETVRELSPIHPKKLSEVLGKKSVRNWWGGKSQAAKHSLDILMWRGQLKVVRRENGIKIYSARDETQNLESLVERKRKIILTIVNLLAPVTEKKLGEALRYFRTVFGESKKIVGKMTKTGELIKEKIGETNYYWPAEKLFSEEGHFGVRFLAPFDPVVWDRNRFEHLWGWQYRFEAYTPKEKRIRGYYAMPLLWNEDIIGWANVSKDKNDLEVDLGFINKRPKSKVFEIELDLEIERLKKFLGLTNGRTNKIF